ncbi:MAG: ABC transporter permease subunit [Anaerolineae bacterium]|nr:ABC transporter permease subunit [Anaerolineae bacterium]
MGGYTWATRLLPVSVRHLARQIAWRLNPRHLVSYLLLTLGSLFMVVPLLWMITASFKPAWQIFANPIIWIPQHWEEVRAGTTNRMLPLWTVEVEGGTRKVIQVGVRRYTTVIDASKLHGLQEVPAAQLSEAATAPLSNGITANIRQWTTDGEVRDVVAVARGSGESMMVVEVDDLVPAVTRLPLDEVNAGRRATITVEGVDFRGREVTLEDGTTLQLIPIGPESELSVVADPEVAKDAILVPAEALQSAGYADVGATEIALSRLRDDPTDYVVIVSEQWQPVINEEELDAYAFIAERDQLGERTLEPVNGVIMQVAPYSGEDGTSGRVVILVSGTARSLVIPVERATTLRLAQAGGLTTARGDTYGRIPYRVQDGFEEGEEISSVALVGDPRQMSLVVPRASIAEAFDAPPEKMQRTMYPSLRLKAYEEVLETKIGETYFANFFLNSFILVVLNVAGHVLSCVVVAYAFARLRAPGKNILFLVLLGTMMLPFPVTLIPVYEIFRWLGMIDSWWPLFVRSFFGNAFLIFMLRQFFTTIPRELEEAAVIDGASVAQVILRVVVPLSKPAIATVVIFTFWWTWNSFLEPFIFLSTPSLFPVSVGLNFFKDEYGAVYYDRLIAASVLSMTPMLVIFFLAQRYFIEGIQLTGLKG